MSWLSHKGAAVKKFIAREKLRILLSVSGGMIAVLFLMLILTLTTNRSLLTGSSCSGVVRRVVPFSEMYNIFAAVEFDTKVCVFSVSMPDIVMVPLGRRTKITQLSWRRILITTLDEKGGS